MKKFILLVLLCCASCSTTSNKFEKMYTPNAQLLPHNFETPSITKIAIDYSRDPNLPGRDAIALAIKGYAIKGFSAYRLDSAWKSMPTKQEMTSFAEAKGAEIALYYVFRDTAVLRPLEGDELKANEIARSEIIQEEGSTLIIGMYYAKIEK